MKTILFLIRCQDCGEHMEKVENAGGTLEQKLKGIHEKTAPVYICPKCGARHGAKLDGTPFGTPGTKEERKLRQHLHFLANKIWPYKKLKKRAQMYRFFYKNTGIEHIGEMKLPQLKKLIALLNNYKKDDLP